MVKFWKFLTIPIVVAVCLGLLLVPGLVSHSGNTVYLKIEPAVTYVLPGQNFTLNVTVPITAGEDVAAAECHIDFDSAYFNVTNVTPSNGPSVVLKNVWDNSTTPATVDFAAGSALGEPPHTSNFTLCTIECQAHALEGSAAVVFVWVVPKRMTRVLDPNAVDYLTDWSTQVVNGTVKIGLPKLTVNVTPAGKGNVTINATTPPSYPNTTNRSWDEVVNLTAVVSVPNWTFTHWSGDLSGSVNPTNITMDDSKNVTANFAPNRTLTMAVTGNGTTVPAVGSHTYGEGTVVNISADPDPGWEFVNWTTANMSEIANATAKSTTVTVDENKTVTANFAEITAATLEGHVTFPAARAGDKAEPFMVKLFEAGNLSNVLWTGNATTNSTGVFNITDLDPDTYDIGIKNATCVSELESGKVLTAGNTTVVNFTIREGDVHSDDYVDMADYSDFSYAFMTLPSDVKWNANADLDRSGYIDMSDYSMFSYYFNELGDAYGHF
jgi:uncharacterized repeat protein (TIGR02543 family)